MSTEIVSSDTASRPHAKGFSINEDEVARFSALAETWWDPKGPFAPLHKFNPTRLDYIQKMAAEQFPPSHQKGPRFSGLRLLDVGCGGGLLAEPMKRLGFDVTAIDASEKNIKTALTHAAQMDLTIDYRAMTAEQLALEDKDGFDVVLNMEVIEHVEDPRAFVATTASLVRPGGMMIIATLNRTMKALGMAIIGAEYVLGWLPKGTHSFSKFLKPQEILDFLEPTELSAQSPVGVSYNPLFDRFSLSDDCSVNYMVLAKRPS
jgi:2-polyprenyl-6-hydroxyphenyl methylase / 3-demethylubiquinone-9 3-methyltransferase